jgi:hypothetical protein
MDAPVNPNHNCCTMCTGNTANNIFWQTSPPGFPGKCKLDLMTYGQVYAVLRRTPRAKIDLLKITSDTTLVALANTTPVTESDLDESERVMKRLGANTLPYYTIFKGKIGGGF